MTHIVPPSLYPTKKSFKLAVMNSLQTSPIDGQRISRVYVDDPSMFAGAMSGDVVTVAMAKGMFTVTNHPKRSWFACVKYKDGKLTVD